MSTGYNPSIDLLGVSTVVGNQSVEKTTQNAADLLHAAGLGHIGERSIMSEMRPVSASLAVCMRGQGLLDLGVL